MFIYHHIVMKFVIWSSLWTTWDYCASVVWSRYQIELDQWVLTIAINKPNSQTKFLFDKAQLMLPTIQDELDEGSVIDLVNHTKLEESIPNRSNYQIENIVDCHPIQLTTTYNIDMRTAQVWSTCTLISEIFIDKVFIPEIGYLILLLAWIVVDTQNFTSEHSTERDVEAFEWIKELANIEFFDEFIEELLEKNN